MGEPASPTGQRRGTSRPAARPGTARQLGGLLCCLVVVAVLAVAVPEFDPTRTTVASRVDRDVWTEQAHYAARVTDVGVADAVTDGDTTISATPGTTWLVVTWQLASSDTDFSLGRISALVDGKEYLRRTDFGDSHQSRTPAGFTDTCTELFQVPSDSVSGARLELAPSQVSGIVVFTRVVEVDLGLADDVPVEPRRRVEPCHRAVTP
ncbi:hypothetical protein ACQBAU_05050 [Propionibacteriaceae bacterium Y2011]|uniref:hypothetical protein n=1 Tax=Microlunatus sp. Y2014 TaxID=3418488 RepID=UPI003B4A5832